MKSYEYQDSLLKALSIAGSCRSYQESMPPFWLYKRINVNDDFQEIRLRYGFHSVLISRTGMEKILHYFKHVVIHAAFDIDVHFIPELKKYGLRSPIVINSKWKITDIGRRSIKQSEHPSPYCDLETVLNYNDHGFYANAESMEKLLKKANPKTVVELGSWLGKSTRHIGKNIDNDAKIYAVDHWKGNVEHRNSDRKDVYHLLPTLYEQFLSNVIHDDLTGKIIPWRMTTLEAAEKMKRENIQVDLVYVDAAHDESSVYADLCAWYPFVRDKGVLCGDDWGWGEELPVRRAVERFAEENNLRIIVPSWNFWILTEKWRGDLL